MRRRRRNRTGESVETLERAREIVAHVATERLRWNKLYDASDIGVDALMDSLVLLAQADNERITGQDEKLTKANRQLGASKARETKLKKQVAELKDELKAIQNVQK